MSLPSTHDLNEMRRRRNKRPSWSRWVGPHPIVRWEHREGKGRIGVLVDKSRSHNWLELFFDLIFVAAAIKLATLVKHDIDHGYWPAVYVAAIIWFALFNVWSTYSSMHVRFAYTDFGNRLLSFVVKVGLVFMVINVPDTLHGGNRTDYAHLASEARGFVGSLLVVTVGEVALFVSITVERPALRLFVFMHWGLKTALTLPFYVAAFAVAGRAPETAAALVLVAQFFAPGVLCWNVWGLLYNKEAPLEDDVSGGGGGGTGARARRPWCGKRLRDRWSRALGEHEHVPVDIDHFANRLGELVMLVIGESVIGCVLPPIKHDAAHYLAVGLSFHAAFNLCLLYFDSMPHAASEHALRRDGRAGVANLALHLPLTCALLAVGMGFKLLVYDAGARPGLAAASTLCVGAAVAVACMLAISVTHKGLKHATRAGLPRREWARRAFRAAAILVIGLLPVLCGGLAANGDGHRRLAGGGGHRTLSVTGAALAALLDGLLFALVLAERGFGVCAARDPENRLRHRVLDKRPGAAADAAAAADAEEGGGGGEGGAGSGVEATPLTRQ